MIVYGLIFLAVIVAFIPAVILRPHVLDDDPCDCGTVRGPQGFYLLHAIGDHPDCTG